jgi:hypothetical protein
VDAIDEDQPIKLPDAAAAADSPAPPLAFHEHLKPTNELVKQLLNCPQQLKAYLLSVHSLVELLESHPAALADLPGAASLVHTISEQQQVGQPGGPLPMLNV